MTSPKYETMNIKVTFRDHPNGEWSYFIKEMDMPVTATHLGFANKFKSYDNARRHFLAHLQEARIINRRTRPDIVPLTAFQIQEHERRMKEIKW